MAGLSKKALNKALAAERSSYTRFSFDMLGEGARTDADALVYFSAYSAAIDQIGAATPKTLVDVKSTDGISVKLSALHCRYYFSHHQSVMEELLPRIKQLCLQAKSLQHWLIH